MKIFCLNDVENEEIKEVRAGNIGDMKIQLEAVTHIVEARQDESTVFIAGKEGKMNK